MNTFAEIVSVILSTGVLLERLVEVAFDSVEQLRHLPKSDLDSEAYKRGKRIICSLLVLVFGPAITLGFSSVIGLDALSVPMRFVIGIVAGALAPYAHALIGVLDNAQQLMSGKTEQAKTDQADQADQADDYQDGQDGQQVVSSAQKAKARPSSSQKFLPDGRKTKTPARRSSVNHNVKQPTEENS